MVETSTVSKTRFLGLDVHKATITVAVAEDDDRPPERWDKIPNEPAAVRKMVTRLSRDGCRLKAVYEAGPTGYGLQRQLTDLGVECAVAAPALIPHERGKRVKTDTRDAVNLARLLRRGDVTAVWVPDREHEALRSLVRARFDAKEDHQRARQRLAKFLLQEGVRPPHGVRAWTLRYHRWLDQIQLEQPPAQVVFEDYRAVERAAKERVKRLDQELRTWAQESSRMAVIMALQILRGIGFLTAVTIVAEVGDFRRFAFARGFMSFIGVVASEHSSGERQQRGGITRAGNRYLRHVIVQSAHHARHAPCISRELSKRLEGMPSELVEIAQKSQQRLHYRYRSLSRRIGRPKAVVAVGRELAGFVWALGVQVEELLAA